MVLNESYSLYYTLCGRPSSFMWYTNCSIRFVWNQFPKPSIRSIPSQNRLNGIHYWLHTVFILRFSIERDCALCVCVYAHMACDGQTFAFITSTLRAVEKKFQLDTRKKHKYTNWIDWGNPRNRKYCASCVLCDTIFICFIYYWCKATNIPTIITTRNYMFTCDARYWWRYSVFSEWVKSTELQFVWIFRIPNETIYHTSTAHSIA